MNLLKDRIKPLYFKYLTAAFGSALISSIYGVVDMAMVGQYQGPEGTAALAVIAPIWNIIYSLGLLTGVGGSVLFSVTRGGGHQNDKADELFTTACILSVIFALICWFFILFFDTQLLTFFGATEELIPLAKRYLLPIKFAVPMFLLSQLISAFLRNDNAPSLATKAVLAAGVLNVFADYLFVFVLDLGIMGAGIATALGCTVSVLIMLTHFLSKKNTLRFKQPTNFFKQSKTIVVTGFSTFFVDIAMGVLTILFNRQIMKFWGTDALAVYGIIVNISTFVQCCAYSIGQATQPIISINFGAKQVTRITQTLRYALMTCAVFGIIWTVLTLLFPNTFVRLFMAPTQEVRAIAPAIMRAYGLSFLLLPLNIFSTYYFQAILKPNLSFIVSISRGVLISGALILLLPLLFGADAIWFAMPLTEAIVAVYVVFHTLRVSTRLNSRLH